MFARRLFSLKLPVLLFGCQAFNSTATSLVVDFSVEFFDVHFSLWRERRRAEVDLTTASVQLRLELLTDESARALCRAKQLLPQLVRVRV